MHCSQISEFLESQAFSRLEDKLSNKSWAYVEKCQSVITKDKEQLQFWSKEKNS